MKNILKYAFLSLAVLAMPLFASADSIDNGFSEVPPAQLSRVNLQLFFNGKLLTKNVLNVAINTTATLKWTSAGKGCLNNWDGKVTANGESSGTFSKSRVFIITCYGLGTAQTAKLNVNVTYPDLTVASFKIDGLTKVMQFDDNGESTKKAKPNTYLASPKAYVIHTTIKNAGGISSGASKFSLEYGQKEGGGVVKKGFKVENQSITPLKSGESVKISLPFAANSDSNTAYYFRAVADSATAVGEGNKENNNASRWIGPFIFE